MSRTIAKRLKVGCAAAAFAFLGLAGSAEAQYSGNPMLRNPGASTPSPSIRRGGPTYQPSNPNPYWRPGKFRSDMPGAGLNPNVRGSNSSVPPCPPARPNCNPNTQ